MSGKSPTYAHRRKSSKPAPETVAGFLNPGFFRKNCGRSRGSGPRTSWKEHHRRTFVLPQFRSQTFAGRVKEVAMKKFLIVGLIAGSFISLPARAQERAGDAALGAVSGAVVLGPVGAVAGALIGYTAGPSIARSWGVERSAPRPRARRVTQSSPGNGESATHGAVPQDAQVQQQAAAKISPPPAVKTETVAVGKAAPPAQGFE
jgi:hypothetical protein